MEGPGRTSAAALSVVPNIPGQRIEPPAILTEKQAALWREIVATKPSDWWKPDSAPLLVAYCKAVDVYERLATELDVVTSEDMQRFKTLCELTLKQAKLLETLATKMRLSQQARMSEKAAATADRKTSAEKSKPWERRA